MLVFAPSPWDCDTQRGLLGNLTSDKLGGHMETRRVPSSWYSGGQGTVDAWRVRANGGVYLFQLHRLKVSHWTLADCIEK